MLAFEVKRFPDEMYRVFHLNSEADVAIENINWADC